MKKFFAAVLLLFTLAVSAVHSEPSDVQVTKAMARKAMGPFLTEPTTDFGYKCGLLILTYSKQSEDVKIVIGPSTMPWMKDGEPSKTTILLTCAYMAGSVRSQWEHGVAEDDPVAGEEQVIATYQQMKEADPELRLDAVEKFVEMKAQDKLEEYVKSLRNAERKAGDDAPKKHHPGLKP